MSARKTPVKRAKQAKQAKAVVSNNSIDGKFWMIQSDWMSNEIDAFGNHILQWPGKSCQLTKEEALKGAQALAARYPARMFYVMEAVSVSAAKQPVTTKVLK